MTAGLFSWHPHKMSRCPICRKPMRQSRTRAHIAARHPIAGPRFIKRAAEHIEKLMNDAWVELVRKDHE